MSPSTTSPHSSPFVDSPARNTRSHTRTGPPLPSLLRLPAAHFSPRARRQRAPKDAADLPDQDVWSYSDETILACHLKRWKSKIYDHFIISLKRELQPDGSPDHLAFIFTCKEHPDAHKPHQRRRMATSSGTGNLQRGVESCRTRHPAGLSSRDSRPQSNMQGSSEVPSPSGSTSRPYTPAYHRALLAIRCARNHRPANIVADPEYLMEVEMLRPGTIVPSPSTVGRDIETVYLAASSRVKDHFKNFKGVVHLQVDGWQSPLVTSFMGVVLVWYEGGKIWRATLEFCRLTSAHTGNYMGDLLVELLERYGLTELFFSPCMDNASVCDKTVKRMAEINKAFPGMILRLRCWAHAVNLSGKAFIAPFFESPPKPAVIKAATRKRKRGTPSAATVGAQPARATRSANLAQQTVATTDAPSLVTPDTLTSEDDDLETTTANEERALFPSVAGEFVDPGRVAHDIEVIDEAGLASVAQGLPCSSSRRVPLSAAELDAQKAMAIGIFPKVAGLARKVHDSATIGERFQLYVKQDREENPRSLPGHKTTLDRRVPTRWNSDLAAIRAHVYFEHQVRRLTASDPALEQFALSEDQWKLARELSQVLEIFEGPTKFLSQAETPLVHEVLPMMESLIQRLKDVETQKHGELHEITVLAARSALAVAEKYQSLASECEIYEISIVLCPNKRVAYFKDRGLGSANLRQLRARCIAGFKRLNPATATTTTGAAIGQNRQGNPLEPVHEYRSTSVWASSHSYTSDYSTDEIEDQPDTVEAYLNEPVTPKAAVVAAGGLLRWWETQRTRRPNLTRMALAYLTAPATSVDAERAFSEGRLSVNHLQHNMSANTFRAKMALASWIGTPLLPSVNDAMEFL